jgi:hypothetical protein
MINSIITSRVFYETTRHGSQRNREVSQKNCKESFIEEMEDIILWQEMQEMIEPYYPNNRKAQFASMLTCCGC